MTQVVPINQVIPFSDSSRYFIEKMKQVLLRQGQIEPLQVYALAEDNFTCFVNDAHASDIVFAARELGWPTLLVDIRAAYEL